MEQHQITIPKTARYFTLGEIHKNIEQVWIVCHGYGQLANIFLRSFRIINNEKNFIIAPEGLHRYYVSGLKGRVGASWMTSEDRHIEIKDYVKYLDEVYNKIMNDFENKDVQVNALGFSQGAVTLSRWLLEGISEVDNIILWSSGLPDDIDLRKFNELLVQSKLWFVVGKDDELMTIERVKLEIKKLEKHDIDYKIKMFEGGHEIKSNILKSLADEL